MKPFLITSCLSAMLLASSAMAHPGHDEKNDEGHIYNREEIKKIVAETLMAHPELIIESVQQMQVKKEAQEMDQMRQAVSAYKTSIYDNADSPMVGNPKGDVTIVEFFDYNCGYCKRSLPDVMRLVANDKNVKVIFKDFPVLSPTSAVAAKAAIAVHELEPKKFFDYHSALFKMGQFNESSVAKLAESMDIDRNEFVDMLNSDKVEKIVNDSLELGQKLGARGVPLFIIGDQFFPGAASYETLSSEVARVRKEKKAK